MVAKVTGAKNPIKVQKAGYNGGLRSIFESLEDDLFGGSEGHGEIRDIFGHI